MPLSSGKHPYLGRLEENDGNKWKKHISLFSLTLDNWGLVGDPSLFQLLVFCRQGWLAIQHGNGRFGWTANYWNGPHGLRMSLKSGLAACATCILSWMKICIENCHQGTEDLFLTFYQKSVGGSSLQGLLEPPWLQSHSNPNPFCTGYYSCFLMLLILPARK